MEKDHQGSAINVLRASWDRGRKTDVRSAFKRARCIVPAPGYHEWRTVEGGKQPYFMSAADDEVLSIAGLWDQWKDRETGEVMARRRCRG